MSKKTIFSIILGILVVLVAAMYAASKIPFKESESSLMNAENKAVEWKNYTNDKLHLSFEYPAFWGEVVVTSSQIDALKCEPTPMRTYRPNRYVPDNQITFSNRDPETIYIALISFDEIDPLGCDDSGQVNLVQRQKLFAVQEVGIKELPYGWRTGIFKSNEGNLVSYYPDYYDEIGTEIAQVYELFSSHLLVQAWILYDPVYGTPELEEIGKYECKPEEKYGTCGLAEWLRKGTLSTNVRNDFAGLDHLIRTLNFQ